MKKIVFTGSATAMVTPFTDDGIDLVALNRTLDYQMAQSTDALVMAGTTGEPSTMSMNEKADLIEHTVERVNGRLPVIAGVGGNNTKQVILEAKQAKALGVDALLAVTPYYNKTTQAGMVAHFNAVADATDLPIILYNVPSRTGLNMLPETLCAVVEHENIVAIKEASSDIVQIAEMARLCPDISLYSGNDDQIVPILSLGGRGVISVLSNVAPKQVHDMCALWFAGDVNAAKDLQLHLLPLVKALFCEVNPIPVKAAVERMGFVTGGVRLPLVSMTAANFARLEKELKAVGLIK